MQIKITDKNGNEFKCNAMTKPNEIILQLPFVGDTFFHVTQVKKLSKDLEILCSDATASI